MTIFQLAVYSCISLNFFDGSLQQRTCRWDSGALYQSEQICNDVGKKRIGEHIFSDVAEDRRVEQYRCGSVSVTVQ